MIYTSKQKRESVKNIYNIIAEDYSKLFTNIKEYEKYIDNFMLNINKGAKILDAGCGSGEAMKYMANKGMEVTGVDFSSEMLNIAKQRHNINNVTCEDICKFKTNEKFDGIFCRYMLFHLPTQNLKKVIKNFYNMLNDGGKLCIISDLTDLKGEQMLDEELSPGNKIYYNFIDLDELKEILLKEKFNIDNIEIVGKEGAVSNYTTGRVVLMLSK